jgi:pyruvate/2-oxoglutarate dehydrogenase complex dihydrolipoamide dehydrogenase (E3) component
MIETLSPPVGQVSSLPDSSWQVANLPHKGSAPMSEVELLPRDEHNAVLLAHAHPPDWQNPTPLPLYDLVVIGGGTAGLVSAAGTAGLGGKVALIERHLMGGDCLNYGCVPSKALIRAARSAYEVQRSADFGVSADRGEGAAPRVDFSHVMARMRRLRAGISHHDSAGRFTKLGVNVFLGQARFTGTQSVEVGGQTLRFKRAIIATGARAARPDIPGLADAGFLTNETVFSLTELPRRLIVIGGGPIGCELAQAFRRFGSEVTLVQRGGRLLPKDEPESAQLIARQFAREGIRLLTSARPMRVEMSAAGKRLVLDAAGEQSVTADAILVAAGRTPNVDGLDLEAAGVAHTARGVTVNDFLQTTNPRIFAAGDIAGSYQFTHAADAMARICIQNALFSLGPLGKKRLSKLVVPWTTFTDPEVAHVGLAAHKAAEQGIPIDTYREELRRVDRAILDGEDDGFALIHTRRGTADVVGCTIVGSHAGEMIGEISLLMTAGIKLSRLASTIHCYPTQVEVLKQLGDQYNKSRLTPRAAWFLRTIVGWRR